MLQPFVDLLASPFLWIHPDILSFGSFVVALPGFYFYTQGDSLLGSLFILGAAFDAIDGTVARKTGKISKFGGVLDATLDRIFDGFVLFCLGVGALVSWEILFPTFIAFITVSFIKAKAEAASSQTNVGTNEFSVGIAQRGERLLIILVASIANYFLTNDNNEIMTSAILLLLLLSIITSIWRGLVIRKALA